MPHLVPAHVQQFSSKIIPANLGISTNLISAEMTFHIILRILFCFVLLSSGPNGMSMGLDDGVDPYSQDPEYIDSSPGLAFFALFAIITLLLLLGAGVVFGMVACGLAALLVGLGIVSASTVYGLTKRSPAAGFRAMFLLSGAVAGLAAGIGVSYIVAWMIGHPLHGSATPLIGALVGLTSGLFAAGLFNIAWTKAIGVWNKSRSKKHQNSSKKSQHLPSKTQTPL